MPKFVQPDKPIHSNNKKWIWQGPPVDDVLLLLKGMFILRSAPWWHDLKNAFINWYVESFHVRKKEVTSHQAISSPSQSWSNRFSNGEKNGLILQFLTSLQDQTAFGSNFSTVVLLESHIVLGVEHGSTLAGGETIACAKRQNVAQPKTIWHKKNGFGWILLNCWLLLVRILLYLASWWVTLAIWTKNGGQSGE